MTIKMSVNMLNSAIFDAYRRGLEVARAEGDQRVNDSTRALIAENSLLKDELARIESEAARRVTRAETELKEKSYPAVREEQLRIIRGIRAWGAKREFDPGDLLFSLALGDVK
jgi:hypothetical protein